MPWPAQTQDPLVRVAWALHSLFLGLHKAGFAIYYKEPNMEFTWGEWMCIEYGLVRLNKDFFPAPPEGTNAGPRAPLQLPPPASGFRQMATQGG